MPPPKSAERSCEWPGCCEEGGFPAPRSRTALRDYRWFCLTHVRHYNASWNYYAGMTAEQIEAHIRADTTWRRPSWPLGNKARRPGEHGFDWSQINDPLGLVEDPELFGTRERERATKTQRNNLTAVQQQAVAVMEIAWPTTLEELRSRYKMLVKRHHPDTNQGDREAEERLKAINLAYNTLKQCLREAAG